MGRKWESPEGNLYCSTLVQILDGDPPPSSLSFVTSLAVHDVIKKCAPEADQQLKWPNDVQVDEAKICGILLETSGDAVIIGIGVNVAVMPVVESRKITSLYVAGANPHLTAADVLDLLAASFASRLESWRRDGLPHTFSEWEKRAHPSGALLSVSTGRDSRVDGEYAGLTADGALRLRKTDGTLIEIHAGDVETG